MVSTDIQPVETPPITASVKQRQVAPLLAVKVPLRRSSSTDVDTGGPCSVSPRP